jgi:hypothetical protein
MTWEALSNGLESRSVECLPSQKSAKILIATNTWSETNGLTTTLRHTIATGERQGYTFDVLQPGAFFRVQNPLYGQYWHACPTPWQVRHILESVQPQAVHIATEGPIGLAMRQTCRRRGWRFTTSFHTRWDAHVKCIAGIPSVFGWQWTRWFHARSARVLVPTASIAALLREHGFMQPLVQWPKGN